MDCKLERFAKDGMAPDKELRWRDILRSSDKVEMSGDMDPDRDLEDRLMEVTRLDLSQFTPGQLQ